MSGIAQNLKPTLRFCNLLRVERFGYISKVFKYIVILSYVLKQMPTKNGI